VHTYAIAEVGGGGVDDQMYGVRETRASLVHA
jgi:hypothetical protein